MGPRHISEILPGVIDTICEASELSAAELIHRPWRTHTDEQLGIVEEQERAPVAPRQAAAPAPAKPPSDTLTTMEVADLCRAHFKTFGNLQAAADHYGLADGRLSQIQTGLDVSCPRVLKVLGIVRERSGTFRRAESCNQNASAPN
jgi:hypothetical protein